MKRACILLVILLAGTAALTLTGDPAATTSLSGVRSTLPPRVGAYRAEEILFCQNPQCAASFAVTELSDTDACSVCGAELDLISVGEKRVLPEDTVLAKKLYRGTVGAPFSVSIVLSGAEQRSIHRPQQCLPAQGYVIEDSRVLEVPLEGRDPLKVMLLDLRRARGVFTRAEEQRYFSYAYWFAGSGRETPYHLQRLWWMSSDRVARNLSHRWAYIGVMTARAEDSDRHLDRLNRFIAELYPLIRKEEEPKVESRKVTGPD